MPASVPAKKRGFLRFLLWFALIVVALELCLRLFGYGHYVVYRPDERLLWLPLPGHNLTEANHKPITISEDGFRYKEKLGPKQNGQVRVFAFGDSVTMGWGVGDDSTYSAFLERMLNAKCPRHNFQVVDAGINAYPNSLVLERMKKVIEDQFKPDVVVIGFSGNTRMEGLVDTQGAVREKFLNRVRVKGWLRRSAIYDFVIEDLLRSIVYYRLRHMMVAGSLDTRQAGEELDVKQFTSRLNDAFQVCQSNNVKMILLVTGTNGETTPEHPFQGAMLEFGRDHGIPVINMIDVWKRIKQDQIFQDYGHPNPEGHELIAQQLFGTIQGLDHYCSTDPQVSAASSPSSLQTLPVKRGTSGVSRRDQPAQ
jgi:lysophospholipase L1-like esterase